MRPNRDEDEARGMKKDAMGEPPPGYRVRLRTVLRVAGVEKSFHRGIWPRRRTIPVLKDACLEIRAGELVGLVGENGSGKSTLMQIIVGLLERDAGDVGRPARFGYCPQVPMLWDKLTVDEHFDLFARAYGLDEGAASRAAGALLAELDFARYRGYRIEESRAARARS